MKIERKNMKLENIWDGKKYISMRSGCTQVADINCGGVRSRQALPCWESRKNVICVVKTATEKIFCHLYGFPTNGGALFIPEIQRFLNKTFPTLKSFEL
jgi:hypothetical protein